MERGVCVNTLRLATFEAWMKKVDLHIARKTGGLVSDDLIDCPYGDWFDDGVAPSVAAARAIRNEMNG